MHKHGLYMLFRKHTNQSKSVQCAGENTQLALVSLITKIEKSVVLIVTVIPFHNICSEVASLTE